MAALVACESLRSYNRDVCVASFTTRCTLLDERVARSSCCLSQLGSDAPAVTTASGLFSRLPSLSVWVGAINSSAEVLHCRVEGVSASICARCCCGNSGDAGSSLDNKRTTPSRASRGTTANICFCGSLLSRVTGWWLTCFGEEESTRTTPATSSGYRAAYVRTYRPPKEWPTSTKGPSMPAPLSKVCSSLEICLASRGSGPISLQPIPARS